MRKFTSADALDTEFVFESYGVRVKILTAGPELQRYAEQTVRKALLDRLRILDIPEAEHSFGVSSDKSGRLYLYKDGEEVSFDDSPKRFSKFLNTLIRITIAEFAQELVFLHAGVVGWKGRAIVMPANSFRGKTTLVGELVRNGAEYYSDEYAVIDDFGLVHDFPRDLSVRYSDNGSILEKDVPVEQLGGKLGLKPLPIGVVLLTEYAKDAVWEPELLTAGRGIMEMIPHTISRNINPEFSLKVLNTAVSDAIIVKSPRGEAAEFAINFLSFFDNISDLA